MFKRINITLLIALLMVVSFGLNAQQCSDDRRNSTPAERFIILEGGVVKDRLTGLLWQRCTMGQTWLDGQCKEDRN